MIFSSIYTRNYISTYLIIVNVEVVRRAKYGHEGGKVRLGSAVGSVALALRLVRPYHAEQIGANEEIAAGLVATSYKQKKKKAAIIVIPISIKLPKQHYYLKK